MFEIGIISTEHAKAVGIRLDYKGKFWKMPGNAAQPMRNS